MTEESNSIDRMDELLLTKYADDPAFTGSVAPYPTQVEHVGNVSIHDFNQIVVDGSVDAAKLTIPVPYTTQAAQVQTCSVESSGGFVNYYLVQVDHPQRVEQAPYQAECEDIIEALELNPNEANIFKEIWRTARSRQGVAKEGHKAIRAAEKYVHYGQRELRRYQRMA